MNPTSSHLITAIAEALRTHIAPLVADQPWPSSELRSIDALLTHLAARVEHEHTVLLEDNIDLDAVLGELAGTDIDIDIAEPPADGELVPGSPESLHAANLDRRATLEAAIHRIHDGTHSREVEVVRSYLLRAAERDRLIFGPFSTSVLF